MYVLWNFFVTMKFKHVRTLIPNSKDAITPNSFVFTVAVAYFDAHLLFSNIQESWFIYKIQFRQIGQVEFFFNQLSMQLEW